MVGYPFSSRAFSDQRVAPHSEAIRLSHHSGWGSRRVLKGYYMDPFAASAILPKKKAEVSMRVSDIMEVPPVTVTEETTIDDAAKLMWEKNVGSVIVVDKGEIMRGIVTEKDVVFSVSKLMTGKGIPVSSIMSRTHLRASPREGIATAVEKMRKAGVRHLPVVDRDNRALGMISMRDAFEISEPLLKLVLHSTKKRPARRKK